MGWKDEQRERDEALAAELRRVHAAIDELKPAVGPYEPPVTAQGDFRHLPGLSMSLRLCRDYESGETLLQLLKPVPREYRSGVYGLTVNCPCGTTVEVPKMLAPCGGCDRFYVGDESGVWAVRLPAQEPDAAAA